MKIIICKPSRDLDKLPNLGNVDETVTNKPIPNSAIIAYRLGEAMLPAQRLLYKIFKGDLTMMLVFGELGQYSARRRFKDTSNSERFAYQICNAHSIALASGIPRETVRRKLFKLNQLGWIILHPNGDFSLNEQTNPPLNELFRQYNKALLASMRSAINDLNEIEFEDEVL